MIDEPHATLVLATANQHKVAEIQAMLENGLGDLSPGVLSAADYPDVSEPVENGATFKANALIKALAWMSATGFPALADDSGLVVDGLDGLPGIHSARYAATAQARIERVLNELENVSGEVRTARFVSVMALVDPSGLTITRRGEVPGRIITSLRGQGGFGYDPIFELTDSPFMGRTLAELSPTDKNSLSHRGRAMEALMPELIKLFRR
jgi:XTP/dITP diphosphohydrolase